MSESAILERQTDTIRRNLLTIDEDDTDLDELKTSTDEIVRNLTTIAEAEEEWHHGVAPLAF